MTEYVWSNPTARVRHRCRLCRRIVLPGEPYWRMAGLDNGAAWTYKACPHCFRVANTWSRRLEGDEWWEDLIFEWLQDEHPALWASLLAHWRFPDGEPLPLPFQPRCFDCGAPVGDGQAWCPPCDERRIAHLDRQFRDLADALPEGTQ